MTTANPQLAAEALIRKAADGPLRVFLGFKGVGGGRYCLVTSTVGVTHSLPHSEITVEPGADPDAVAALLTARWAELARQKAKGKHSTTKPARSHRWRRQTFGGKA